MKKTAFLSVLLFCLLAYSFTPSAYAQKDKKKYVLSTKSKKAKSFYIAADQAFNANDADGVVSNLTQAVKEDTEFIEAWMMLGDVYMFKKEYEKAAEAYSKSIRISPTYSPDNYYYLGTAFLHQNKYPEAKSNLQRYLQIGRIDPALAAKAKSYEALCDFRIELMSKPVPFAPLNLGEAINTADDEYLPTITADEQILIITRREKVNKDAPDTPANLAEDFYISRRTETGWSKAVNLGKPINTDKNEGAQALSPDGQILIFTACHRDDGYGSCDLYVSFKTGNRWTIPKNMGSNVNSAKWDSQPSISSDGKTVYFASGRDGGKGGMDIWTFYLQDDGNWSKPTNMGDIINTKGHDMSPFIHPDDQTLYFASDGRAGMGGLDIYYSRRGPDGQWQTPVNIGYPINSEADESSLIVSASGKTAYFASNSLDGFGKYDIYSFELYEDARPQTTSYVKGRVFDAETKISLSARFELIDVEADSIIVRSNSDAESGSFLVTVPPEKDFALNVSKEGYLFYSENFSLKGKKTLTEPFLMDIPLQPIKEGTRVVLKNVFFEHASFALLDRSRAELSKLIAFMKASPNVRIEIGGHTDAVGRDDYNLTLSNNRAKSVYEYLINNGISKDRLSYKGYGKNQPIATNDTEEGRALNRRTEFKVMGIGK